MSSVLLDKFSSGAVGGGGGDFSGLSTFTYADLVAARADEANRTDGEYADIPTGMCKLVSGVWVPQYVADNGTVTIVNQIKGDVVPASEAIPWAESSPGSSTITSDGTKVTMTTPTAGDTAAISYVDTEAAGGIRFMDGMLQWTITTFPVNAAGAYIALRDGAEDGICALDGASASPYRYGFYSTLASTGPIAASGRIDTGGPGIITEHRFTWISDADTQTSAIYIDGLCVAQIDYATQTDTSTKNWVFNDGSGGGAFSLTIRELVVGVAA
jgi:hypothetical protein